MLLICTLDQTVVVPALAVMGWGNVHALAPGTPPAAQATVNTQLAALILTVGPAEDICFSAHGNDEEIGGDGRANDPWGWTAAGIAGMLHALIQLNGWHGRVLFHVCCESIANFSARVAAELGTLGAHGIWCYGYNRSVGCTEGVPTVTSLDKNISIQGTKS